MIKAAEAKAAMAALPLRGVRDIVGEGPVLVLAPHPDDESLGCGGMIAEAVAQGIEVHVAVLTDGSASHPGSRAWPPARLKALRAEEVLRAVQQLGLSPANLIMLEARDGRAPHAGSAFLALALRLEALAHSRNIAALCASWRHDPHVDHGAAARLAAETCRRIGARHLSYPVWGWTLPDDTELPAAPSGARLDIAAHLPAKRRAIAAHASQHPGLITDSPRGFHLPPDFIAMFERPWEVFLDEV
jgi:LmbE family N-acetylglucosaminyl deacetylase